MSVSFQEDREDPIPEQLVEQLIKGYDALSEEIQALHEQRKALENKLSWAKRQYLESLKRFAPTSAPQEFRVFLGELDEAAATEKHGDLGWIDAMSRSQDVARKSRAFHIQQAADAREKFRYRDRQSSLGRSLQTTRGKTANIPVVGLEHDFTVPGTPGKLRCPFAPDIAVNASSTGGYHGASTPRSSMSRTSFNGRRSKRASFHDPIRAEICGNIESHTPTAPSTSDSVPLCPIRFLDQHSPEEVAAYFEKHKHELPKSHEACVRRYQSNEQQIKELDEKYGNLVTMIQGLGVKHQPMLPEDPAEDEEEEEEEEEDGIEGSNSKEKIKHWAKAISESLSSDGNDGAEGLDRSPETHDTEQSETRESRFERPLKEVRLGESPSRPWGIQIPAELQRAASAESTRTDQTASPRQTPAPKIRRQETALRCPFGHGAAAAATSVNPKRPTSTKVHVDSHQEATPDEQQSIPAFEQPKDKPTFLASLPIPGALPDSQPGPGPGSPAVVFNGPVIIGYSMEQAITFLKACGRL